ncbi:hypothetical protein WH47_07973 [Habropoda laboriosa]|uniref:Uncharacterized protein n=1 Tax=Habropoda laboriosa TaxID=597456 RepID=A0A0L7QPP9_9HYME|nr:hypothetical protein WH47_07973 [Habropoda laboriosa]
MSKCCSYANKDTRWSVASSKEHDGLIKIRMYNESEYSCSVIVGFNTFAAARKSIPRWEIRSGTHMLRRWQ